MSEREYPINTWDQLADGDVFLCYYPDDNSRGGRSARSVVNRKGFKTDPNAHWQNYGNKVFYGKRVESLPKAMAWAGEKYGINSWRKNAMGDWIDATKDYKPLQREVDAKAARAAKRASKRDV